MTAVTKRIFDSKLHNRHTINTIAKYLFPPKEDIDALNYMTGLHKRDCGADALDFKEHEIETEQESSPKV
ncbi:MAG TPA: hypothetical protein VIL23_04410 [Clostridia bacterium]